MVTDSKSIPALPATQQINSIIDKSSVRQTSHSLPLATIDKSVNSPILDNRPPPSPRPENKPPKLETKPPVISPKDNKPKPVISPKDNKPFAKGSLENKTITDTNTFKLSTSIKEAPARVSATFGGSNDPSQPANVARAKTVVYKKKDDRKLSDTPVASPKK